VLSVITSPLPWFIAAAFGAIVFTVGLVVFVIDLDRRRKSERIAGYPPYPRGAALHPPGYPPYPPGYPPWPGDPPSPRPGPPAGPPG
jgi:hypothetical protein